MRYKAAISLDIPGRPIAGSTILKFLQNAIRTEMILQQNSDSPLGDIDMNEFKIEVRLL